MAYAALSDVLSLTGRGDKLLSRSSPISATEIEGWLDDYAAEIDTVLVSAGITPPLASASGDAPRAWSMFKRMNTLGAASQVELRLFGDPQPGLSVRDSRGTIYRQQYEALLGQIREGDVLLDELEGAPGGAGDLASSGSDRSGTDPFFTRGQIF